MNDVRVAVRGGVVRDLLRRDGSDQAELARRLGISEPYLSRILDGGRPCSWQRLIDLAAALRVQPTTVADVYAEVAA